MAALWQIVPVFISATFEDMQAERDHVVRFVFPRLRRELLKRQIHFIDVDLRWGVTSEQDALEVCREIIDECRPRFLCMLGERYGWTPSGQNRSITADEVHHAALEQPEDGSKHFFYFRQLGCLAKLASLSTLTADQQRQYASTLVEQLTDRAWIPSRIIAAIRERSTPMRYNRTPAAGHADGVQLTERLF